MDSRSRVRTFLGRRSILHREMSKLNRQTNFDEQRERHHGQFDERLGRDAAGHFATLLTYQVDSVLLYSAIQKTEPLSLSSATRCHVQHSNGVFSESEFRRGHAYVFHH